MSVISLQYSRLPMTLCRCACAGQGHDGAPSLDVMLLKQQVFLQMGATEETSEHCSMPTAGTTPFCSFFH